jgi:hypothetical protein
MTDKELKQFVADLATSIKELRDSQKELQDSQKLTERQVRQTGKQLGELGRKLGRYTESMAEESVKRILLKDFKMDEAAQRVHARRNGRNMELDFLAFTRDERKTVIVVEIKSSFNEEDFQQVMKTIEDFPKFFTEHADKKLYAMVVAVDIPQNMRQRILKDGIYLAILGEDVFKLIKPKNFKPKQFNPNLN